MRELARGHEHERARVRRGSARNVALHDLVNRGKEVGCGLAASRVRARHHVLAREDEGDRARLHGRRGAVPLLRQRAEQPRVEPEGVPTGVAPGPGVALRDAHRARGKRNEARSARLVVRAADEIRRRRRAPHSAKYGGRARNCRENFTKVVSYRHHRGAR
jgi:hypothetical protein